MELNKSRPFQMLFVVLAIMAMALTLPGQAQAQVDDAYRLGAGDQLRVIVFGEPELTGEYQVDGSGRVTMPLIGEIRGQDLTASEVEDRIREALVDMGFLVDPSVSVEVLSFRPFYILGEVGAPGSYDYVAGMTVTNAVAIAGGYTYRARQNRFRIERPSGDGNIEEIEAGPRTQVRPGDIVTVLERWF